MGDQPDSATSADKQFNQGDGAWTAAWTLAKAACSAASLV